MSSTDKQVSIRPTSNEDVREYHIGQQITHLPYAEFFTTMYGSESDFDQLGTKGKQIAEQLVTKKHEKTIARATFRPFSVRVYKSPTVDWATVESTIVMPALRSALGESIKPVLFGTVKYRELTLA